MEGAALGFSHEPQPMSSLRNPLEGSGFSSVPIARSPCCPSSSPGAGPSVAWPWRLSPRLVRAPGVRVLRDSGVAGSASLREKMGVGGRGEPGPHIRLS